MKLLELPLSTCALVLTLLIRTERTELWDDVEARAKEDRVTANSFADPLLGTLNLDLQMLPVSSLTTFVTDSILSRTSVPRMTETATEETGSLGSSYYGCFFVSSRRRWDSWS